MEELLRPPQPDKYPPVVYKYRDWSNDFHKRTLLNCELFLSSPENFNDPYDCNIPIAYWKLAEDTKLAMKYFSQMVKRQFPCLSPSGHLKEVERFIEERRFADQNWILKEESDFFKRVAADYGIISLTEFKDDIQMWSHYSNSHTGFCIGFKSQKLFSNEDRFGMGGKVDYVKDIPVILPTENLLCQIIKVLYTKYDTWTYEQEYRLTKIHAANKAVTFTIDEVAEIIIGCSANIADVQSIINICKCNLPGVPIFMAKQKRLDFKLEFEQILKKTSY